MTNNRSRISRSSSVCSSKGYILRSYLIGNESLRLYKLPCQQSRSDGCAKLHSYSKCGEMRGHPNLDKFGDDKFGDRRDKFGDR
jgi:hypothetical protein